MRNEKDLIEVIKENIKRDLDKLHESFRMLLMHVEEHGNKKTKK